MVADLLLSVMVLFFYYSWYHDILPTVRLTCLLFAFDASCDF